MWLKRYVSPPHASGHTGAQSGAAEGRGGGGEVQAPQAAGRECSPPGGVWVEGGSWNFEKPSPTLDSNSNHGPQAFLFASTGQFRAQALLRESSGLPLL